LKICFIGKYPPIQGGVSARAYRIAHGLARRGHEVHVITNAREVEPGHRAHMRPDDWERCQASYPSGGRVAVHWTALRPEHRHIPAAAAFVTRLASTAVRVAGQAGAECIFSFYLEPYGVAGHLAAGITRLPHVVKLAGSDAGRLWPQPDMQPVYEAVLGHAAGVLARGGAARLARRAGLPAERLHHVQPVMVSPEEFTPEGPVMDDVSLEELASAAGRPPGPLPTHPRVGLYGKLQPRKGTATLLRAVRDLRQRGVALSLVVMAGGASDDARWFDAEADALALGDSVLRVAFVPPWRIPAFLRACSVVACLEQDFPVRAHAPARFQEAMAAGRLVVASAEVALKQPQAHRLAHGYNCLILPDAEDVGSLSATLQAALAHDDLREAIASRARRYAECLDTESEALDGVEQALRSAIAGEANRHGERLADSEEAVRGWLTRLARAALTLGGTDDSSPARESVGPQWFAQRLARPDRPDGVLHDVLRFGAQLAAGLAREARLALLLRSSGPAVPGAEPVPRLSPGASVEHYSHDFRRWCDDAQAALPRPGACHAAVVPGLPPQLVFLSRAQAELLRACDGTRTVAQVEQAVGTRQPAVEPGWQDRFFEQGLLELR
jgi:glycosyltransferase involved in cell wall biosynthesis